MGVFDDRMIGWKDRTYVIPADRVLGAIARIEDIVTFNELLQCTQRRTTPLAKMAQAYGAVLRYAGARVADEEIYEELYNSMTTDGVSLDVVASTLDGLLTLMVPAAARDKLEDTPSGNSPAGAPASSSSSMKSSSEMTG